MSRPALHIQNLRKRYGQVEALRGIDLEVERGELFGLIGPDGAGKTTLIRTICGLLKTDAGRVEVMGRDVHTSGREIRSIIGYMPQHFSLYQDLSVEQNLRFFADLYQVPEDVRQERLEELYRFSRLKPFRNRKAGALSGGMKQKLALSCALIYRPQVLVLDEPTFGVDPVSRQELWQILKSIREAGTTIFVSTAYMEEADLCDRVALIYAGRIVRAGNPMELRRAYPLSLYRVRSSDLRRARKFFESLPDVGMVTTFGDSLHVAFETPPADHQWQAWRASGAFDILSLQRIEPSIEDVFLYEMVQAERATSTDARIQAYRPASEVRP